jgi:hypothetical protein
MPSHDEKPTPEKVISQVLVHRGALLILDYQI